MNGGGEGFSPNHVQPPLANIQPPAQPVYPQPVNTQPVQPQPVQPQPGHPQPIYPIAAQTQVVQHLPVQPQQNHIHYDDKSKIQANSADVELGQNRENESHSKFSEKFVWYALVFAVVIHSLTVLSALTWPERIGFRGVGVLLAIMATPMFLIIYMVTPIWLIRHLAEFLKSRAESRMGSTPGYSRTNSSPPQPIPAQMLNATASSGIGGSIWANRLVRWCNGWRGILIRILGIPFWFVMIAITSICIKPFETGISQFYFMSMALLMFFIPLFGFITGFAELSFLRTLPQRKQKLFGYFAGERMHLWNGGVFVALGIFIVTMQLMPEKTILPLTGPALILLAKPLLFLISLKELRSRFFDNGAPGARQLLAPAHLISLAVLPFLFTIEVVSVGISPIETQVVQMFSPHGLNLSYYEMADIGNVMLTMLLAGEVAGMLAVVWLARRERYDEQGIVLGGVKFLRRAITIGVLALLPLAALVSLAVIDGPHVLMWAKDSEGGDELEVNVYPMKGQDEAILHIYTPGEVILPSEVEGVEMSRATIRLLGIHGTSAAPDLAEFPIDSFFREQGWYQLNESDDIWVYEVIVEGMDYELATFTIPYGIDGADVQVKSMVRMVAVDGTTLDWRIAETYTPNS